MRPSQSVFMGHVYRIVYSEKVTVEGSEAWGACDNNKQEIEIQKGMNPTRERAVMIHEVMHQLLNFGGGVPDESEERLVTWLGDAIGSHIEANPEFWAYVCRKAKK